MNKRNLNLLAAILFLITANIWFFVGNRMLALLFLVVTIIFAFIGFRNSDKNP